ncbi:MAG: hypothetical protein M3Y37_04130, partial [Chloroflexota bacterium]|nr:hypothetical protein [Chloroflexota bacterium]
YSNEEEAMDASQFDNMSRRLAGRSTRRDAVRTGGLMAAVAGAFGVRSVARAQDDDEDAEECTWAFRARVIGGPNEDAEYDGTMQVEIERDGAIDRGTLETDTNDEYQVVGNTRGKAISLRVKIGRDLALALTGVGDRDIRSCQGSISGTFAGPEYGDYGVWEITRRPGGGNGNDDGEDGPGGAGPIATATTGSGGGNPPGNPTPTPDDSGDSDPGPTNTPCAPQDCGLAKMWDPDQCMCVCYDGGVDCGPDVCCPSGAVCDGMGGCSCPPGTTLCGNACVAECSGSQILDYNTCTCTSDCPAGQVKCGNQCLGQCSPGTTLNTNTCMCEDICPAGQDFCNGACIDIVNDVNNCGFCGNNCPPGMPCIAGSCLCPPTMKYCASQQMCINNNAACN